MTEKTKISLQRILRLKVLDDISLTTLSSDYKRHILIFCDGS